MNLYLLTTKGLGDFYIVEESPNDAEDKLTNVLTIADYGFVKDRKIINIKLIAQEMQEYNNKPFINGDSERRLILNTTFEND